MSVMVTAVAALAHSAVQAAGQVPDSNVTPGVLGFLVVAGMGITLFFLLRSMNRQLRKIPPPPPEDAGEGEDAAASPAPPGAGLGDRTA
jgi:hypothetical protein